MMFKYNIGDIVQTHDVVSDFAVIVDRKESPLFGNVYSVLCFKDDRTISVDENSINLKLNDAKVCKKYPIFDSEGPYESNEEENRQTPS